MDTALASLSDELYTAAIAKLIPITRINPTALYELITQCEKLYSEMKDVPIDPSSQYIFKQWLGDYTDSSAGVYRAALSTAKATLAGLFDGNGNPSEENNKAGKADEVQGVVEALKTAARTNLLAKTDYNKTQVYYKGILALDGEFPLTGMDAFTDTSWNALEEARSAAASHIAANPIGGALTSVGATGYAAVLKNYWLACHNLESADGAAISLSVTDAAGLADPAVALSEVSLALYKDSVKLDSTSGYTLKALLTKADIKIPTEFGAGGGAAPVWIVTVNGTLLRNPVYMDEYDTLLSVSLKDKNPSKDIDINWNDIKLKDGDKVQLVRVPQPQDYYYIHPINAYFSTLTSNFGQLRFGDESPKTAREGQEISFTVERAPTYLINKTDTYTPRSGAELVAYGPKREDGSWPGTPVRTGFVSDASGNVRLSLDKAGEYLVTAVDMRADDIKNYLYPRLQTPSAPVTVVITPLNAAELTAQRAKALSNIEDIMAGYGEDKLGTKYADGRAAYESAKGSVSSGESLATISAAVKLLSNTLAQLRAAAEEPLFLNDVKAYLAILPSEKGIAAGRLAQADGKTVENLKKLYEAVTPYQRAQLTMEQKNHYDAVMAAWGTDGSTLPEKVSYTVTVKFEQEKLKTLVGTALACSYSNRKPGDLGGSPGANIDLDAQGRFTVDPSTQMFRVNVNAYNVSGSYKLSRIVIEGEDYYNEALPSSSYAYISGGAGATPMRGDLTVTIYGRDLTVDATLEQTKGDAKDALAAAYGSYAKAEYSNAGWAALTGAYNAGLSAIGGAESAQAVEAAKTAAISAMEAIEKLSAGQPGGEVGKYGSVLVTIENNTSTVDDGGKTIPSQFTGEFVREKIPLNEGTTMMMAVLEALKKNNYEWKGTGGSKPENAMDITYLASVIKDGYTLAEFTCGRESGWMGTLNDWFTNEGFQSFRVNASNSLYRLVDGDQISVQYTTTGLGYDLGGTWNSSDTTLKTLSYTGGSLTPTFNGSTQNYMLTLDAGARSAAFIPTAANKNYQVRTYLNTKSGDNWYRRGEPVSVKSGDVVYIGVGDNSWPSMNKQGAEAISYAGTWYAITITDSGDPTAVIAMINALPAITYANYKGQTEKVALARSAYAALTSQAKDKVSQELLKKLTEQEAGIEKFKAVDNVKALLAAVPATDKLTASDKSKVEAAYGAYSKLNEEQRKYITVGDAAKYNAAVKWLGAQGISTPGDIVGSDKAPVEDAVVIAPKVTAKNGVAAAVISAGDMNKALDDAKKSGATAITVEPEVSGEAKKSTVELPKTALSSMAADTDAGLVIATPTGRVTIPNDVLASVASQAAGSTVTIVVEAMEVKTLAAVQQKAAGGSPVFDISILSDGKPIGSFGGKSITVSLPYTLKSGEKAEGVTVWHLNDAGKLERINGKYDAAAKLVTFTTTHLSKYVVGYDAWVNPFTDVKSGDWYYDAVKYAVQKELFAGTSAATFGPNADMTRTMLVTVLYRLEGKPAVTATNSFTDVQAGQWYTDAVIWASANGIVTGYGNGLFGANDSITREQMAAILYRYASYKKYDIAKANELADFTDADGISTYALAAMKWANAESLMNGRAKNTLAPAGTATRGEVATILMRFAESTVR